MTPQDHVVPLQQRTDRTRSHQAPEAQAEGNDPMTPQNFTALPQRLTDRVPPHRALCPFVDATRGKARAVGKTRLARQLQSKGQRTLRSGERSSTLGE